MLESFRLHNKAGLFAQFDLAASRRLWADRLVHLLPFKQSAPFPSLTDNERHVAAARRGDAAASDMLRAHVLVKAFHANTKARRNGHPFFEHTSHVRDRMMEKFGIYGAIIGGGHDMIEENPDLLDVNYLSRFGLPHFVLDAWDTLTKRAGELYPNYIERVARSAPAPNGINYALETKIIDMLHNYNSDLEFIAKGGILSEKHMKKHHFYQLAIPYLIAIRDGTEINGRKITPDVGIHHFAHLFWGDALDENMARIGDLFYMEREFGGQQQEAAPLPAA